MPSAGQDHRDGRGSRAPGPGARALRLVFRHYPLLLGSYRIVNDRRVRWVFWGQGERLTTLPCGLRIWVDLQDNDGRAIFCGGNDPKLRRIFEALLREGDWVVDVGANHGEYALLAAHRVGDTGQVFAFEPQPVLARRLERSVAENGLRNLTVLEQAVGNRSGQGRLRCFAGWSGGTQVVPEDAPTGRQETTLTTLDDCTDRLGARRLRLLKIDVEGMEGPVLRGATRLLAEHPPEVILFESNRCTTPFFDREAPRVLADIGRYVIFEVCRSILRLRLRPVGLVDPLPSGRDFLAVERGSIEALEKVLPLDRGADAPELKVTPAAERHPDRTLDGGAVEDPPKAALRGRPLVGPS
jgi:FkbM family methyltransferase